MSHFDPTFSPLGKPSDYINQYSPELLFPISRKSKRDEIAVSDKLPFFGFDTWNAYELSWLNPGGKPMVAIAQFDISCASMNIIESKSFKLYLNSFNNTVFQSLAEVEAIIKKDVGLAVDGEIFVKLFKLEEWVGIPLKSLPGELVDDYDVVCNHYLIEPGYLTVGTGPMVSETLRSDLLKSNCLVTGQPDWGSVCIQYTGRPINKPGLLKYIVSFRDHNEFHEQCVERIFMDIMRNCNPEHLTVEARYTRRGGLDINPVRSTKKIAPTENIRMVRQ